MYFKIKKKIGKRIKAGDIEIPSIVFSLYVDAEVGIGQQKGYLRRYRCGVISFFFVTDFLTTKANVFYFHVCSTKLSSLIQH